MRGEVHCKCRHYTACLCQSSCDSCSSDSREADTLQCEAHRSMKSKCGDSFPREAAAAPGAACTTCWEYALRLRSGCRYLREGQQDDECSLGRVEPAFTVEERESDHHHIACHQLLIKLLQQWNGTECRMLYQQEESGSYSGCAWRRTSKTKACPGAVQLHASHYLYTASRHCRDPARLNFVLQISRRPKLSKYALCSSGRYCRSIVI